MFSEGYRTHRGVTGPRNFKKSGHFFFFGNSCSKDFGDPGCHPSTLIDLANTAVARKSSVKTIRMISSGYRNQRGVTGPMNFRKTDVFFPENRAPGILGALHAIQALYLTLQSLLWLVEFAESPYA